MSEILRKNPLCVISKDIKSKRGARSIQTNSNWVANPYGDAYAIVLDDLVPDILATDGFCDIELNEDGTEVVSFTVLDKPEISKNSAVEQRIAEIKDQLAATDYKIIKCSEAQLVGEELPYDIAELHAERQALRDQINELEGGAVI